MWPRTSMLAQTKTAVEALLKAGYHRSEFTVRTPRNWRGEYGLPTITVWAEKEVQLTRLDDCIKAGLRVTRYISKDGIREGFPGYVLSAKPGVEIVYF